MKSLMALFWVCRPGEGDKPSSPPRLEHSAQGIAHVEALVPRTAEDRIIGNLVLDAELAKPSGS
jgi:hypothetical protein